MYHISVNLERNHYQSKLSDKFVFYTGPKVTNDPAERSRSPRSLYDQRPRSDGKTFFMLWKF